MKINSVKELFDKEGSLRFYLTKKWLVYKIPNRYKNVSRWDTHQAWYDIQNKLNNLYIHPLTREKIKTGNLEILMDQASGILITIGALSNTNLVDTLNNLGKYCEDKLKQKKSSFKNEREHRIKKFY